MQSFARDAEEDRMFGGSRGVSRVMTVCTAIYMIEHATLLPHSLMARADYTARARIEGAASWRASV